MKMLADNLIAAGNLIIDEELTYTFLDDLGLSMIQWLSIPELEQPFLLLKNSTLYCLLMRAG